MQQRHPASPPHSTFAHDERQDYYRTLPPLIDSSSPFRDLPSTPPSPASPTSPTLSQHGFLRHSSTHDPFAATSKADLSQHPTFSKQHPHVKHPSRTKGKRSLPNSPNLVEGAGIDPLGRIVQGSSDPWAPVRQTAGDRRAEGSSGANTNSSHRSSSISRRHRDRVLGDLFVDTSEDALTSDDHLEAVPWSAGNSDVETGNDQLPNAGLGLGSAFREQGSPTAGRRTPRHGLLKGLKRHSISRTTSINDPFGAFQSRSTSLSHGLGQGPSGSPGAQQPVKQRRRLTGTSPRKLGGGSSGFGKRPELSDSDEEGIAKLVKGSKIQPAPAASPGSSQGAMAHFWHKVVESVWDSGETRIDVSDRQISTIHPVVADLSNYVAIDPPRSFEPTTSATSLPSRTNSSQAPTLARAGFSRASTSANAFRGMTFPPQAGVSGDISGRGSGEGETVRGAGKGKLHLYLMGNQLTKLPSALFEVGNLRVLSLRNNNLAYLPPAIGDLSNLRELNISRNPLTYLPAEIQKLSLDQFAFFPNSFLPPPARSKLEKRALLAITGVLLASQSTTEHKEDHKVADGEDFDDEEEEGDDMEADFIASAQATLSASSDVAATTPTPRLAGDVSDRVMGPPPLPVRLLASRGPAGIGQAEAGPSVNPPRRTFDRTRSDIQINDLLSRGGGRMVSRSSNVMHPSSLRPPSSGMDADGDQDMDPATQATEPAEEAAEDDSSNSPAEPSQVIDTGVQVARVLGPLEREAPATAPSLRELCIRRLLSPCDASRASSEEADDSNATITVGDAATTPVRKERSVVWARVPSSSSAYQFRYQSGRRPLCLLESYENGALRDLESGAQMAAGTIKILEAARRSMEGKWGSGSGISGLHSVSAVAATQMRNNRGLADSWCKGVSGSGVRGPVGREVSLLGDSSEEDEADIDSSSADEPDDEPPARRATAGSASSAPWALPLDVSGQLDTQGDDACLNPYFNRCPNPQHKTTHTMALAAGNQGSMTPQHLIDYPLSAEKALFAPLYEAAMERRMEWVSHIGGVKVLSGSVGSACAAKDAAETGVVPILWRGCSRGCLAFLEA